MYLITITFAKIINKLINLLKVGSGNTLPGHLALKLYPGIWRAIKNRLPKNIVLISGTNGKTTTCKLVTHILERSGKKVLTNNSGANLLNGVLSAILLGTDKKGKIEADALVLEVDELALPSLLPLLIPTVVALLNLSRDQLDRYWETDLIYSRWESSLLKTNNTHTLILDSNQKEFKALASKYKGDVLTIGDASEGLAHTKLKGEFNAKNVNCALMITAVLGLKSAPALASLSSFSYAYGRGEEINYLNKCYQLFLAKNPESLNQNLKMLLTVGPHTDALLFILNDNTPDGLDVSWIYDVHPTLLKELCLEKKICVSGTRAFDMATRLHYAGVNINESNVSADLRSIVTEISSDKDVASVNVLPNYSAMLELRKILLGRKIL